MEKLEQKQKETSADGSGEMFNHIASDYDRLNRLMTFGLDILWRKKLLASISHEVPARASILDLACGTGDLAISLHHLYPKAKIYGVDPSKEMLNYALKKAPPTPETEQSPQLIFQN